MSKRQGGELNHENWNEDGEPEEAGQFRQASSGALQGRVIKTARRRKAVGGDEAAEKSAFSGFGGFAKQPATDAAAAFSFIGKPAAGEKPAAAPPAAGGFVFGNAGGSSSKPAETSGFSFGSSTFSSSPKPPSFGSPAVEVGEPPAAKKAPPVFGSFGGAPEAKESKGLFGAVVSEAKPEQPAAFGAFSFGSKAEEKPAAPAKVEEAPKGDLMAMFKPSGGWSCSTCMISNPADKNACAACETPKPGSKPVEKPAPAFGAAGGFSFGAATTASNSSTSGFSFGASKSEENKENTATSGFSFGAKTSGNDKPALGAFAFGGKPAEEVKSTTATESFSFGAKTSTEATSNKPAGSAFSFGAKSSDDSGSKPSASTFSFGSKAKEDESPKPKPPMSFGAKSDSQDKPSTGGFSFGMASKPTPEPEEKKPAAALGGFGLASTVKPAGESSGFSFGKTKATYSGTSFGNSENNSNSNSNNSQPPEDSNSGCSSGAASPARGSPPPSRDYLAHLKALNLQVAGWINQHLEQNPLVLLTPVFKDYEKHLAEITEKHKSDEEPKKPEAKAAATSFSQGSSSSASSLPTAVASPFSAVKPAVTSDSPKSSSFGAFAAASTEKPTSTAAPFSFGLPSTSTPSSLPAFGSFATASPAASGFSFGLGSSATSTAPAPAGGEEVDEDAPPVVEVKQVAEDDAKYSKKCKLFYKKDGSYVEKGVGMLYLKTVEGEKTQLLVRADTNLGNVLLNILLSSQIPTTRVGKNNVMLVCVPNPPVDPKADTSAPCPMLIR